MSDIVTIALVAIAGVFTGILSGMFGVGGAIISTPVIRALGATPLGAVGSTIPSVLPSAVSGSLRYRREGLIRWRVVAWTAGAGIAATVGGALLTDVLPGDGHPLMILTAGFVGFSAFRVSRATPEPAANVLAEGAADAAPGIEVEPHGTQPREEWWRLAVTGLAAGLLSGLLGIGGGVLMVPLFTGWIRVPLKDALGTSLACVGVLAVPGMITHLALGHIDWLYALPLCVGVVPGARIGAHLAISASDRTMRVLVGVVLGAVATAYAIAEIIAIV
ncbi:MAG: sulfite exporter TauE/SafE family protein [Acidimicrobiia bacterium]